MDYEKLCGSRKGASAHSPWEIFGVPNVEHWTHRFRRREGTYLMNAPLLF
ncbi:MAG: hypothetical protein LBH00_10120 [Planctomycetaceae bacterium]|nr:hypothetical protein [Planctomycetaceae bacterium]